jgi:uncharacterized protein (TIGR00369 family)
VGAGVNQAIIAWSDPAIIYEAHRAMSSLDLFRAMQAGDLPMEPAMALLGTSIETVEAGEVAFRLDIGERHLDHTGCLQTGILAALTDTAAGYAVHTRLPAGARAASIEFHVSLIEPVTLATGRIRIVGRAQHVGRRTATCDAHVIDSTGALKAAMGMTMMVLPGEPV